MRRSSQTSAGRSSHRLPGTVAAMTRRLRPASLYPHARESVLVPLVPPPTHITLYTGNPGDKGIGIHDESDLRSMSEVLDGQRDAEVREAMRFDVLFG